MPHHLVSMSSSVDLTGTIGCEHLGIAGFSIHELERFSEFKDRELNSYCPLIDTYRRMLKVFEPISHNLIGQALTASQIIEVLKAK